MISKIISQLKNNIQLSQTFVLLILLVIWVEFYNLNLTYLKIFVVFTTVALSDFIFYFLRTREIKFPFSWINAAFGILFFLRTEYLLIYFFAGFLAIAWKNILRIRGRHFMNPSNMGVFITLALFPHYTWINTLQWGDYIWTPTFKYYSIIGIILLFWAFITFRVYQFFHFQYFLDYLLPFFILHIILFFVIPFHETVSTALLFFSVSFFIFMFHMMSDPKTVPETSSVRFLYATNIVLTFYILQFHINEGYAILGSLFFNTLFLPLIWFFENKNIKNTKINYAIVLYLIIITFMIVWIWISIIKYWRPDLLFDNICSQLICK